MIHLTDCRSLYDLLHRRGTVPSERRLFIDIEALRNDIETNGVVSRWINTKQMLADCLTKDDVRAADYLRYVLRHGTYQIVEDPMADQIIYNERMNVRKRRASTFAKSTRSDDDLRSNTTLMLESLTSTMLSRRLHTVQDVFELP